MGLSKNIQTALKIVSLPWLIYMLDFILPIELRRYGLQPRQIEGLWGIAAAPFLHGGLNHLVANTGALFILLVVSLSYSRKGTVLALLFIALGGAVSFGFSVKVKASISGPVALSSGLSAF